MTQTIELRPFASLGAADHGWLDARHHFSFAEYRDPARMHWGHLRVWNDDTIAAGAGFAPHPHADMEIVTYVRSGAISHRDSLGNEGRTAAGDVQVMSAGSGIRHSEVNAEAEPCTLFQIWILPDEKGAPPAWDTAPFPKGDRAGRWVTLASGMAGDDDALPIRANARVLGATLGAGETIRYQAGEGRALYLVAARGSFQVGDVTAQARDGVAIKGMATLDVTAIDDAELVMVDTKA